jgi:hypothetical protein
MVSNLNCRSMEITIKSQLNGIAVIGCQRWSGKKSTIIHLLLMQLKKIPNDNFVPRYSSIVYANAFTCSLACRKR